MASRDRKMEEAVYKLIQKVDDLKEMVQAQAPILEKVSVHEERISWLKKAVLAAYGLFSSAAAAALYKHH